MTVHYMPNPMWGSIALCTPDPNENDKGTHSWDEVTCKKCLELKDG